MDRQPFGEAPEADPVNVAPPKPSGPSYADALRVVAMTISGGDIRVGLVDSNPKPPKTYFLFVGDEQNGIRVVDADYEAETVVVEKDGDQRTLRMGAGGGSGRSGRVGPGPGMIASRPSAGNKSGSAIGVRPSGRAARITEARRLRMEERKRRAEKVPELTGAVLEKHLEEYNMQAIREGMPPLPIPLTPEQDAQLVREGVLPPVE